MLSRCFHRLRPDRSQSGRSSPQLARSYQFSSRSINFRDGPPQPRQGGHFIGSNAGAKNPAKSGALTNASELKPLLAEIHSAALNRAKAEGSPSLDVLARVAIIKFLRIELGLQFAQILERCRMTLKSYEGVRAQKALEYRERVAAFQVAKKVILRKTGQELF